MEHFWDTIETIVEGYGFSLFGARHLVTLALFVLTAVLCCRGYARADAERRAKMRRVFAILLLLLAVYPMMLFAAGDIRPSAKGLGKSLLLLLVMAIPIYGVNLLLDTNYMFLMYAPDGNPLAWFQDRFGSHWVGFPVLLAAVGGLMYLPVLRRRKRETAAKEVLDR